MGGAMCYQLERFLKAQQSYKDNTPIQAYMRECLLTMLLDTQRKDFPHIFEFGCGQCELTYMLTERLDYKQYICNDINEYKDIKLPQNTQNLCFDMRNITRTEIYSKKFDLIASNACLQWLPFVETLQNLKHILLSQGFLLIGTFGIDNFREIKEITGIGLPYIESCVMKKHLESDFELLSWHEERISLSFESPLEVFRHIKKGGVNALQTRFIKKSWLTQYTDFYNNTLTYHIICFLAKRC